MFLRNVSKIIFPQLENDLKRCVGKEISSMEELTFLSSPKVFGYVAESKVGAGGIGGAFNRTAPPHAPTNDITGNNTFIKLDKNVEMKGLFQD
mmetsp:Transcript_202/g.307  ORF Transcript_202/g.307 Transcript_202/m.307 type:complete len:93 (+) Transcript_202:78-356(+)|eukprot:CAMPEP_0184861370 /NCGR_PEP_ID=MMETSP0580-20130426/6072_1 /TAXON_ID=1118495 /ORGANISM="Dactyliosolen fragilissimus" /LENGTH=92 /DNA_ID=CAMNT_0027358843 /DNA_START=76 /DNA_END=354 /DNA_ORIENTATION=-